MLDINAIREAIATRIQTTTGIAAFAYDVVTEDYPRAIVLPDSPLVEYHTTMADMCRVRFRIEVRTNAAEGEEAQIALGLLCNAGTGATLSVFDALEQLGTLPTPDLGGVVQNINVETVEFLDGVQLTEGPLEFTAIFRVAVKARRD